VRVIRFAQTTGQELETAISKLRAQGMKDLLVDLRSNGGGLLSEAVDVLDQLVPNNKLLVYTRGRIPSANADYKSSDRPKLTDAPVVVLIDHGSASASEIVSGAIQDLDRGLVVGTNSFGKGLVQNQIRLNDGSKLLLTIAHYYTPSGRLIQRPWDVSFDEYLSYSLRDQDANKPHSPADLKQTDAGRPVYSGGGIEPDKRVAGPIEGFNPARFGRMLYARSTFANYAQKYAAEGDTRVSQQSSGRKAVKPNFVVDEAMVADYREQLKADHVKMDEEGFQKDLEFIKAMIRFEIDNAVFGIADARRHLIGVDPQAQAALAMFGEAQKLTELSKGTKIKADQ
jgi:carboxyl-terminal processing protease